MEAQSYTAEELKKLAETKADGYGYQYFKSRCSSPGTPTAPLIFT